MSGRIVVPEDGSTAELRNALLACGGSANRVLLALVPHLSPEQRKQANNTAVEGTALILEIHLKHDGLRVILHAEGAGERQPIVGLDTALRLADLA